MKYTYVYGNVNIVNELIKKGHPVLYVRQDYKCDRSYDNVQRNVFVFEYCKDDFLEVLDMLGIGLDKKKSNALVTKEGL